MCSPQSIKYKFEGICTLQKKKGFSIKPGRPEKSNLEFGNMTYVTAGNAWIVRFMNLCYYGIFECKPQLLLGR
jgi:hypothetical protein